MQCRKCGADNASDRLFCAGCGASLAISCDDCGFQNQPDAKFCDGCGHVLRAEAPPAPASEPAPRPSEDNAPTTGERRQVTILFADLAGFTELSSELDAEELHRLVSRFFAAADRVVEHYGGTVDKHMGDAVMALFGAPIAHGDDPLRAVRAAFDIHAAMGELSQEAGRELKMHAGIASGEVVAGGLGSERRREYTVLGESVNLASRLDDLAEAGETLISDAVHRAVAAAVDCSALGEVSVKGLDKPVRVWRARGLTSEAGPVLRGPLVGRKAELRQFAGVLEACRETGTGQAVLLRGEAGIGKTRLVEEFAVLARAQGFSEHKGLVLDFGVGKGQDAIRALVRSLLGLASGGDKPARAAAVDAALAAGRFEPDQRVFLNDLLDLVQPTELRSLYDAMDNATRNSGKQEVVAGLIRGASGAGPLIVMVEDVHWAAPLTLAHLARMTAAVRDCPAVLVMTTRIEGDPLDGAWRGSAGGAPLMTVDLGPLREAEALELASGLIEVSDHVVRDCVERAEGNPLFLEQLLRNAEESSDQALPGSIQSLVLARMDRLPGADKAALQAASAIGQRFGLDLLRHLIEDPGYDCANLVTHYLVRPEGDNYLFMHALIREGVYSSLLKARKRALHARAAQWFAEGDPVFHAEHLDRAEDPAAPSAYLAAAKTQTESYHYERALQLAERGLELAKGTADEFPLTRYRGQLLHDKGEIAASMDAYRDALPLAPSEMERVPAWIGLAAGMRLSGNWEGALEVLEKAQAAAQDHDLAESMADIHYQCASAHFRLGNIDACLAQSELALTYARGAASPEHEARALSVLGDAYYMRGRMTTSHDYFCRCLEQAQKHGFGRVEVANLHMRGVTRYFQNDLLGAFDDACAAVKAAKRAGHRPAEMTARGILGGILLDMVDLASAKEQFEEALNLARRLGTRSYEPFSLVNLGKIRCAEGFRSEGVSLVEQAVSISREVGMKTSGPRALGALALLIDDPATRAEALREGEAVLRDGCISHHYFAFYRDAMEAGLDSGDWQRVEQYAAALEDYTRAEPLPLADFFIARGRALAAWGRGKRDQSGAQELRRLQDEAERVGLKAAVPALEEALGQAESPASVTLP